MCVISWIALGALVLLYSLRVYLLSGFYIVTYGLGIFLLNLFIGFLSPLEEDADGPVLPLNDLDEFKPFVRRLPEFKFWSERERRGSGLLRAVQTDPGGAMSPCGAPSLIFFCLLVLLPFPSVSDPSGMPAPKP